MKRITILKLLFIILMIPAMSRPSLAHKIRIFAWQDGGNIVTESKFSRGRPAQKATVTVLENKTGQNLLSGTTDTEGLFSFPIPKTGSKQLRIIVDGGDGHKNSWDYTLEDSNVLTETIVPSAIAETKSSSQLSKEPTYKKDIEKNILPTITPSELTRIIEATMDKKLAPIRRTLAEDSEKGPTLQDILGGIGYLLGLAGIAAYVQSLKNQKE